MGLAANDLRQDVWGFILRVVLVAFVFLRFFFDGFTHPAFNLTATLVFLVLVVAHLLMLRLRDALELEEIVLLCFVVVSLLSSACSPVRNSGVEEAGQMFGYWALVFLWIRAFRPQDSEQVWKPFLYSGLMIVLFGIYQYHGGLEATRRFVAEHPEYHYPPTYLDRLRSDRIFSTFVYPNAFASYLDMLIPLGLWAAVLRRGRRGLDICLVVLGVYALWRTGSIGGMLVAAVAVQAFVLSLRLRGRRLAAALIVLFLVEGGLAVVAWHAGGAPRNLSVADRLGYWTSAWRIWKDYPVLGVGPGNFCSVFVAYKLPVSMEAKHAHSIFFETLAETGIAGTVVLFGFFALVLRRLAVSSGPSGWARAVGLSLCAGLLHNLNDFDFANPALASFLFVLCGWAAVLAGRNIRRIPLTRTASLLIIFLCAAAGVVAARVHFAQEFLDAARMSGSVQERWAALEKAEALYPLDRVFLEKGELLLSLSREEPGYVPHAVAAYRAALSLNPYLPRAYRRLANIALEAGDLREAEKMYLNLHRSYPAKQEFCLEIALFYRRLGRQEESARFVQCANACRPVSIEEDARVRMLRKQLEEDGTNR